MKILVVNGPNINMLGIREPEVYGKETYEDLLTMIENYAEDRGYEVDFFQSNHEGEIVDIIQEAYGFYDGIVINPAAYTHTSIAIPDAIKAVGIPAVEVHISDIMAREDYRRFSYTEEACVGRVIGEGMEGYLRAIEILSTWEE